MFDWSSLGIFATGAATCFALLRGATLIKGLLPRRAKPQLLEAKNCNIRSANIVRDVNGKDVGVITAFASFELLVDNAAGSKDCSVLSIELRLPDGVMTDFTCEPCLPTTISPGRTEHITVRGVSDKGSRIKLQPKQHSVEATAVVKFNTGKIIKKKISFIIKHT